MRIALDATAYDEQASGAKNRAVGLGAALLRAGCDVTFTAPERLAGPGGLAALVEEEHGAPLPRARFRVATCGARRSLGRVIGAASAISRALPRGTELFVTDYAPVLRDVPTVLTVHDLRALARPRGESPARVAWFRLRYPAVARRAALVTTPSRAMADEAARRLRLPRTRIAVVPNAVGAAWLQPVPARRAEHLLMVGCADPRKDAETAVLAARRLHADGFPHPLVLAGRADRRVRALAAANAGFVRVEAAPDGARLRELVASAAALVHPSRYEGFGIPVLEAFAAGIPVAAAADPAVLEVAGGLAESFPPGDAEAAAAAIRRAVETRETGKPGRVARARSYSWDDAADTLLRAAADARAAFLDRSPATRNTR